ncbi:hypothetical protein FGO68_gene15695 [Halteria grandinella]|uniref:Protein kinase domain-containing protein n=1 Tax=Halteria grandinella TaxID=5974 RepID=A0A8J8NTU2_HALGN|nr:hypothetical protein FGO68_gene15695 [Halteria grandinella]
MAGSPLQANMLNIPQAPVQTYQLDLTIGKGQTADVYRAIKLAQQAGDNSDGDQMIIESPSRYVVVKIPSIETELTQINKAKNVVETLARTRSQDEVSQISERIVLEYETLMGLEHQGIIKAQELVNVGTGFTTSDGEVLGIDRACLVTEYASNHSLANFLSKVYISELLCKAWCQQLLSTLHYMHQQGYAHGNLKIDDLVITEDMDLKIVDFEYAELVDLGCIDKQVQDIKCCSKIIMSILQKTAGERSAALVNFYTQIHYGMLGYDIQKWYQSEFLAGSSISSYPQVKSVIGIIEIEKLKYAAQHIIRDLISNYKKTMSQSEIIYPSTFGADPHRGPTRTIQLVRQVSNTFYTSFNEQLDYYCKIPEGQLTQDIYRPSAEDLVVTFKSHVDWTELMAFINTFLLEKVDSATQKWEYNFACSENKCQFLFQAQRKQKDASPTASQHSSQSVWGDEESKYGEDESLMFEDPDESYQIVIEVLKAKNHSEGQTELVIKFRQLSGQHERTIQLMTEFVENDWVAENCNL